MGLGIEYVIGIDLGVRYLATYAIVNRSLLDAKFGHYPPGRELEALRGYWDGDERYREEHARNSLQVLRERYAKIAGELVQLSRFFSAQLIIDWSPDFPTAMYKLNEIWEGERWRDDLATARVPTIGDLGAAADRRPIPKLSWEQDVREAWASLPIVQQRMARKEAEEKQESIRGNLFKVLPIQFFIDDLTFKCRREGLPAPLVESIGYTSRTCPVCLILVFREILKKVSDAWGKSDRDGHDFYCRRCRYQADADDNAAQVIGIWVWRTVRAREQVLQVLEGVRLAKEREGVMVNGLAG